MWTIHLHNLHFFVSSDVIRFYFYFLNRDSQMKTTWLYTNTNMRWHWNLAQQEMTIILLLVSSLQVGIGSSDYLCYFTHLTKFCFPLQTKLLHPLAFWRIVKKLGSSMNLQVLLIMTSKKQLKMTLKRWPLLLNLSVYCLISLRLFICWTALVFTTLQLPLDLSPLATPIIRNRIEQPTAIDAHRDSPLPHPESTTNDEKVWALYKQLLFLVTRL